MTNGFLTALTVRAITDKKWQLTEDLLYRSAALGLIKVPSGFVTDFASVPRLPLAFLVAGDTGHAGAVVHDYLYTTKTCSKAEADRVFLEAMKSSGVASWRAYIMYGAVSAFGWVAWWF